MEGMPAGVRPDYNFAAFIELWSGVRDALLAMSPNDEGPLGCANDPPLSTRRRAER